jgi:uncharacterized protein YjbI with pentapeptide repeats
MLNEINERSMDSAIESLSQHCKNKDKFNKNANSIAIGGEDHKDYTNKGIRRSRVSGKKYRESVFINSAAAGSNFCCCEFDGCNIVNANFQECSFINSTIVNSFENNPIVSSNFNDSLFADKFKIENTYFKHSVFYNTAFLEGLVRNTTFYSCTLEGTTFSNVEFENVKFSDLNIDYAIFEDVKMTNVILPFSQICYTFGLLSYLGTTSDEVYITSASSKNGYISKDEFLNLLPDFITYYTETKDFFPLANIYFYLKDNENAKKTILMGIIESIAEIDFRKIKYLCKLIFVYGVFEYHERQEIIDYIYSHISFCDMHPSLFYSYNVYKKEIESYLLNNNRKGITTAEIKITTEVFPDEAHKMGILISTLEEIIDLYKSPLGEHKIICRHNSAESIVVFIQENWPSIILIVTSIYSVLMGCLSLEDKILDIKIKKNDLHSSQIQKKLEHQKISQELVINQLDIELKETELNEIHSAQLEKNNKIRHEILRRNITENNVGINKINHILYGNIPAQVDKELLQYSYQTSKR